MNFKTIGENYAELDLTLRDLRNDPNASKVEKSTVGSACVTISALIGELSQNQQYSIMKYFGIYQELMKE